MAAFGGDFDVRRFKEAFDTVDESCRRLTRAQHVRTLIEHSYVQTPAGNVHQAAELVRETARDFIARYRKWIEPYLDDGSISCA
jgi:hypothetical protein